MSNIELKLLSYDAALLRRQIAENSRKIDQYLEELKELEMRLTSNRKDKAIA